MSQEFRKKVRVPRQVTKNATRIFVNDTIEKFRRVHKLAKQNNASISDVVKEATNATLMVGASTLVGVFWFVSWLVEKGLLDNKVLRKAEKKIKHINVQQNADGSDKRWQELLQKHPNLSAHIVYYLLLIGLAGGGYAVMHNNKDKEPDAKETSAESNTDTIDYVSTYVGLLNDTINVADDDKDSGDAVAHIVGKYVSPDSANFVQRALDEYWSEIAIALTEFETYRDQPTVHKNETRPTSGLGTTWSYTRAKDGKLIKSANTVGMKARNKNENYEQLKMHLEYETLPALKQATLGKKNIDRNMAIALLVVGYQRPSDMAGIADRLEKAKTDQEKADAFLHVTAPVGMYNNDFLSGTQKRRWWCAMYALGQVTMHDLVNAERDLFSSVTLGGIGNGLGFKITEYARDKNGNIIKTKSGKDKAKKGYVTGHFKIDDYTVGYRVEKFQTGNNTVNDFLSGFETGRQILAQVNITPSVKHINGGPGDESMKYMLDGLHAYKNKDYVNAAKYYEMAIAANKDNMEGYSSLALAYVRLGDVEKNVSQKILWYEKACQQVQICNERMNPKDEQLYDLTIKASSYFNAGLAREALGDIYMQQGKMNLAIQNYTNAQQNFQNASRCSGGNASVYDNAVQRVQGKCEKLNQQNASKQKSGAKTGKAHAFNAAGESVRNAARNSNQNKFIKSMFNSSSNNNMA